MKKQMIYIVISFIVVAILGVSLFLVLKMPSKNSSDNSSSNNKTVSIVNVETDEIVNLNVKNTTGEYNIKIENTDNTFVYSIDNLNESEKLSKVKIDGIINTFSKLTAEQKVNENVEDLSQFGLDKQNVSIKLTFADGSEKTLYLGNDAPLNAGTYLKVDDENTVYLIRKSTANSFLNSASYYIDTSASSSEEE